MIRNGADVLAEVVADIRAGRKPERFRLSAPFSHVPLGPGLMNVIAGPTGVGKTALVMQLVADALASDPALTAFVANVEMDPKQLTRRMVARASGVAGTKIDGNDLTRAEKATLNKAANAMKPVAARVTFWDGEYSLKEMAGDIDKLKPAILVIDYIQRFAVERGNAKGVDELTRLNDLMNTLRKFAQDGLCVLILSAVNRASNNKNMGMASMRGSSELEYATDNVFVMEAQEGGKTVIAMKHEKNRSGPTTTVAVKFDGETYRFDSADIVAGGMAKGKNVTGKPIGGAGRTRKGVTANGQAK